MSSASGSSARAAEAKRRARRVPEDQRKRGIQSCDLCRKKRCRCIPAPGEANRCTTCLAQDVECTFTLPRKTRFYGNVEDLSDRFRCLEAIVKGAFADEATDSIADLMRLGQSRGYQMPDLSHSTEVPAKIDEALRIPRQSETPSEGGFSVPHTNQTARPGARHNVHPSAQPESSQSVDSTTCLVTDTSGKEHYIGPSGGLQFLGKLRRLLISRDQSPGSQSLAPPRVAKFTEDDGAQALEVEDVHEDTLDSRHADDVSTTTARDQRSPRSVASLESNHIRRPSIGIEQHWRRLPTQDVLDRLLQSFFQNVHDDFVLFHRGTFEGDYEAQTRRFRHAGSQEHEEKDLDPGLLACIYMMLVFGSMSEPDIGDPNLDHSALRRHCVSSARSLLPHLISKCTLYNLRALLLLGLFLHNNNERNATWNLVGTATRIAFALGLHRRDTESAFNPIEREIRKRVFCTLYGFEQFLATTLGRPSGINDPDVEVTPPRPGMLDDNGGGGDAVLIAFTIRLHHILGRSRTGQGMMDAGAAKDSVLRSPESILLDLEQWRADVSKQQWLNIPPIKTGERVLDDKEPNAIGFDDLRSLLRWQRSSLRAALMLHLLYHYTGLFTTRPFLLQELSVNQPLGQEPSHAARRQASLADTCLRHASQMALIIMLLDSFGLVNGVTGLDVFYIYWASMILSSGMLRHHESPEEYRVLETFRGLVAQVRAVSAKVEKSGTMNRFATLLADFADYVNYRYMSPKLAADEGLENNATVSQVNGVPGNPPLDPTHIAAGAFMGSQTLDSFYWSNDMIPLAQTIEGGAELDGFSGWAGHVGGVVSDVDWVTTLPGGGIDISMGYGGSPARHQ